MSMSITLCKIHDMITFSNPVETFFLSLPFEVLSYHIDWKLDKISWYLLQMHRTQRNLNWLGMSTWKPKETTSQLK